MTPNPGVHTSDYGTIQSHRPTKHPDSQGSSSFSLDLKLCSEQVLGLEQDDDDDRRTVPRNWPFHMVQRAKDLTGKPVSMYLAANNPEMRIFGSQQLPPFFLPGVVRDVVAALPPLMRKVAAGQPSVLSFTRVTHKPMPKEHYPKPSLDQSHMTAIPSRLPIRAAPGLRSSPVLSLPSMSFPPS